MENLYLPVVNRSEGIMALTEWFIGPLQNHTEWPETVATDPQYGVDMPVDGIDYRRRDRA